MSQIDLIICPVKWVPQSLCNSEGVPQVGIIFSNNNLPTVKAIALLHGKASTQCENMQIITKLYLFPWEGGIWTKSNCHTSKGPLGRGKWPCDPRSDFPGLYLGHILQRAYTLGTTVGESFQTYCFPHRIIFSGAQWVKECICWSNDNGVPAGAIGFLSGPSHICVTGLKIPPFYCYICFSSSVAVSWACRRKSFIELAGLTESSGHSREWREWLFRAACFVTSSASWFPLASIVLDLECSGVLIIANSFGNCIAFNNSAICFPFFIGCLKEVKNLIVAITSQSHVPLQRHNDYQYKYLLSGL